MPKNIGKLSSIQNESNTESNQVETRKRRNRLFAQKSRERKKAELSSLKLQNEQKDAIIQNLQEVVARFQQENSVLKSRISQLESSSNQLQQPQTAPLNTNLNQFSMFRYSINSDAEFVKFSDAELVKFVELLDDDEVREMLDIPQVKNQ